MMSLYKKLSGHEYQVMFSGISVSSFDKIMTLDIPFSALMFLKSSTPHILYNQGGKEEVTH